MVSWRKICSGLSVLLLVAVLLLNLYGSPLAHYMLRQDVARYLEHHSQENGELLVFESIYEPGEQQPYLVQVVFAAQPEQTWYYGYNMDHQIQEFVKE